MKKGMEVRNGYEKQKVKERSKVDQPGVEPGPPRCA